MCSDLRVSPERLGHRDHLAAAPLTANILRCKFMNGAAMSETPIDNQSSLKRNGVLKVWIGRNKTTISEMTWILLSTLKILQWSIELKP